MSPKRIYNAFCKDFPWFAADAVKFTENRKERGIDITLKSGVVLTYIPSKTGWILRKGD